jgi:hypothetical protein
MYNEGSINDLEGNRIMLLRVFSHLGVLALNGNRASARNIRERSFEAEGRKA